MIVQITRNTGDSIINAKNDATMAKCRFHLVAPKYLCKNSFIPLPFVKNQNWLQYKVVQFKVLYHI